MAAVRFQRSVGDAVPLQRWTSLRLMTCGGAGDGKSTLVARLLEETDALVDEPPAGLLPGSAGPATSWAQADGARARSRADREPGISIWRTTPRIESDVVYRSFQSGARTFIVADTSGGAEHTREVVTAAWSADCAVMLVDAATGVSPETRRHSHLVALFGGRTVVLTVNKMDLVDFSQERFSEIAESYRALAARIGIDGVVCIPVSALHGDNVIASSERMSWYDGPTLLGCLEAVTVDAERSQDGPFRMPVQHVDRRTADFRGYAGMIVGGQIHPGDPICVLPSRCESAVARVIMNRDVPGAVAGQSVTLTLRDEIEVNRGDMLVGPVDRPAVADRLRATIVWMADEPMLRGRTYLMMLAAKTVVVTLAPLKHKIDVDTLQELAATSLERNEIGVCDLELEERVAFEPYRSSRHTGGFVLIDRITNATVGAGCIRFALRRTQNVSWQPVDVDSEARAAAKGQRPAVIWLTGLSGAGKSTVANRTDRELNRQGRHTYLLDGDNVRHGLNRDLGFTDADRVENIRRVAEVARLMTDAGLIVLVSFISPFRTERHMARELIGRERFLEVFIDTPLEVAEQRDPKGLYERARRGEIANMTGIDSPYEIPTAPDVRIDTTRATPEEAAELLIDQLRARGIISTSV